MYESKFSGKIEWEIDDRDTLRNYYCYHTERFYIWRYLVQGNGLQESNGW